MPAPPGVPAASFQAALREFGAVVGAQWVFSSDEDLALYDDSYTPFFGEPELQRHASAAVSPTTVEQVQAIVRIANKYKLPLYAISTGRNLGYGGSSPTWSGSVIVDLKRMNKILEVNVSQGYMVVEPGVSFIDVREHFVANNYPFLVSTPDPGWGSPIGNALDHGISSQVAGDNFGMVVGMEVVLPSGEVLRTGCGAIPNSKLWQNYPYGFGPYIDGMFSQSNFGIVTKMGFRLVRIPPYQQGYTVASNRTADMQQLIDASLVLRDMGVIWTWGVSSPIRESRSYNDGRVAFGPPEVTELHKRRDGGTPEEWDRLAVASKIPSVQVAGVARGPEAVVKATLAHAREVFSKFPGTTFTETRPATEADFRGGLTAPSVRFTSIGEATTHEPNMTSRGHFYFAPMFKPTAEDIFGLNDTIRNVFLDAGDFEMIENYGWSSGRNTAYPKALMILMEILVSDDVAVNRKRRALFEKLTDACGAKGWAEYRAPVAFQDRVMAQYSFNNNVLRRFHETVKDAIDPNGILMPGKSGIWPKRFRKA